MNPEISIFDPRFAYLILALPVLFGLILTGDGVNKLVHGELTGIIGMIFGLIFTGIGVFAYLFFSTYFEVSVFN